MGKLIYLDNFRPQELDLPPFTLCGGLVMPYVVDPSSPPKTRRVIVREPRPLQTLPNTQAFPNVAVLPVIKREEHAKCKSLAT